MTDKEMIKTLLAKREWNYAMLAKETGFPSAVNISGMLNSGKTRGMTMENFTKFLKAMGYELVVRDKTGKRTEWVVDMTPETEPLPGMETRPKRGRKKIEKIEEPTQLIPETQENSSPLDLDALLEVEEKPKHRKIKLTNGQK